MLLPLAGRQLARYQDNLTYFLHTNHLGSTGVVTDQTGATVQDQLYYPWGQSWSLAGTQKELRFASLQPRDPETGLDPTPNRLFASTYGRWLSPDPAAGSVLNPQSLNRYGYVVNSPTVLTDPLGLQGCPGWARAWQCIEPHHMFAGPPGVRLGFLWGGSGWVYSALNSIQWTETITTYEFQIVTVHGTSAVVTIDGVLYDDSLWAPGVTYWIPTGKVIDEIQFIQTSATTWTFVSSHPFYETLGRFVQAGFHLAPFDLLNRLHPGQLDLRDNSVICSAHVAINKNSGGAPGAPTTGDIHLDTVNPYPEWSSAFGPGGVGLTALGHGVFDVFGGGLYPGSQACQ